MKRNAWIVLVVLIVSLLGGGIFFATDKAPEATAELQAQVPATDGPEATEVASDFGKQRPEDPANPDVTCLNVCPSRTCGGPGCFYSLGAPVDHGVRCCVYQGNTFTCSGHNTVHQWHNSCGGANCGNPGPNNWSAPYCQ